MAISIKYNNVELYPDNIFDWRASGINCATEDYSVGSINNIVVSYTTNIKPIKDIATNEYYPVYIDDVYFVIREVVKLQGQNRYTVTCASDYYNLDQPLPDTFATPVANETAGQLFYRLQGVSGSAPYPYLPVNKDYVINPNWYQTGMTLRQAYMYLCQLVGVNIRSFLKNLSVPMPSTIEEVYKLESPDGQETDVLLFTPDNVKEIEIADYSVPAITGLYVAQPVPIDLRGGNDLYLPYNPIANSSDNSWATNLNSYLQSAPTYTPMKITTWTDAHIPQVLIAPQKQISTLIYWSRQRNWMRYTDADGNIYNCPIFSWELSPSGLVLEGTGNIVRQADSGYSIENELVSQFNELSGQFEELNDRFLSNNYRSASTETYDVSAGMYLVTTAQYGTNSTASDGMWLVRVSSSYYHYSPILTPADGTTVSAGANQITVTRGSARTTVCVTRLGG